MATNTGTTTGNRARFTNNEYTELYESRGDALEGQYEDLYQRLVLPGTHPPQELLDYVAHSIVPQVFLALVKFQGEPRIVTLHRFTKFRSGPRASHYDSKYYAVMGDVQTGRYVELVEVTADLFAAVDEAKVRTQGETDIAVGIAPPGTRVLGAVEADDDSERLTVRAMQTVPHCYLHMVLSKAHDPINLWRELVGSITGDGREQELMPLIQWMQVAVTQVSNAENNAIDSPLQLGEEDLVFRPWRGQELQVFRQGILAEDFPHWYHPEPTNEDRLTQVVGVMRREADRERAQRNADRMADKAPTTPSEAFPWFTKRHKLLAGVEDEEDLPLVYLELAKAKKAEARQCVHEIVQARLLEDESAGVASVKVTKELYETIKQGAAGAEMEVDNLTKGIQLFSCGHGMGPTSELIDARIDAFDLTMAGEIRPTLVEEMTFKTKEVVLPNEPFLFQHMLQATSVVVDVMQGRTHPHAMALRQFVKTDVPRIIQNLVRLTMTGTSTVGNVYPRLLREVQVRMNTYYGDLLQNLEPECPNYTDIRPLIQTRQFARLAPLPERYLAPAENPASGGGGGGSGTPSNIPATDSNAGLGQPVTNSQPTRREWMTKFSDCGKTIRALREHAPRDANGEEICLSYHLKGTCFSTCRRRASHRVLTGVGKRNFGTFVDQYICQPVAATGQSNSGNAGQESGGPAPQE